MSDPEQLFARELEIFRTEAQVGAQFLYSYLTFNLIIGKNRKALDFVNHTPLFWNTNMGALQTSFFIVLGRIFDQTSKHNIGVLLKIAEKNANIFSKSALAARKRRENSNADEWIDDYLNHSYWPTARDFRELRKKVNDNRRIYETNYRDIRRKVYAHKEVAESADVQKLFSKTNIRELQQVFVFANALYEALWELFHNGRKPRLRTMRHSIKNIMKNRKPEWQSQSVQEITIGQTQDFFRLCLAQAQQGAQPGRAKKRRAG